MNLSYKRTRVEKYSIYSVWQGMYHNYDKNWYCRATEFSFNSLSDIDHFIFYNLRWPLLIPSKQKVSQIRRFHYEWIKHIFGIHFHKYFNFNWCSSFEIHIWEIISAKWTFLAAQKISDLLWNFNEILIQMRLCFTNDTNNFNLYFRNRLKVILEELKKKIFQRCQITLSWWSIHIIFGDYSSTKF